MGSEKIFASIRKVRLNAGASFNEETIHLAHQMRIIRDKDRDFYLDIRRKRVLTEPQLRWKNDINRRIMARFMKKTKPHPN
jgi:hypothetical protein